MESSSILIVIRSITPPKTRFQLQHIFQSQQLTLLNGIVDHLISCYMANCFYFNGLKMDCCFPICLMQGSTYFSLLTRADAFGELLGIRLGCLHLDYLQSLFTYLESVCPALRLQFLSSYERIMSLAVVI
jgi:hypothetical protein